MGFRGSFLFVVLYSLVGFSWVFRGLSWILMDCRRFGGFWWVFAGVMWITWIFVVFQEFRVDVWASFRGFSEVSWMFTNVSYVEFRVF